MTPARLRVSLGKGAPPLHVGDRILVLANLSPPAGPAAPGAFDFQRGAWYPQLGPVGYALSPAAGIEHGRPVGIVRFIGGLRAGITPRLPQGPPPPGGGAAVGAEGGGVVAAFALLAVLLDRAALSVRLVAWSAIIVLIAAPESLTGASFQMSFAAVIALIAGWEAAAGWRRRLHARAELSTHRWLWRLTAGLGASLATTLVASIATGAFAAYHFNRLSLLGVVANLLGVPLTGFWIMPWGLLAMLLIPLGLERFALVPMGWGVEGLDAIARHVADWPQAAMLVPSLPGASLALLTAGGPCVCLRRRRWRFAGLPVPIAG